MEKINTSNSVFYLDKYIEDIENLNNTKKGNTTSKGNFLTFELLCKSVKKFIDKEWDNENIKGDNAELLLERKKNAIIGYPTEVQYFKDKIKEYLKAYKKTKVWHPNWYKNLIEAIFHENWGLAGISNWMNMPNSQSARIIGDRIYYMIDGVEELQEQRISFTRFEQLKKALLLKTPKIRLDKKYIEVYMYSGERITIFNGDLVIDGQQSMIFRKYVIDKYNFEELANRHTYPYEIIPMLKAMVKIGFNVAITGAVRTGKTTFLLAYQCNENPKLEGVIIQTDPEILIHKFMPTAPIMSIIIDSPHDYEEVSKGIKRSDADYVVVAEARDGYSHNIAIESSNIGTRRCKTCAHFSDPIDFCYDVANKIMNIYGGNLEYTISKVAKSYNYIFHFVQLKDKSKKRLKGIYEVRYNNTTHLVSIHQICKYDYSTDSWKFHYTIGPDKQIIAEEEDLPAYNIFSSELKKLAEKYPMKVNADFIPIYNKGGI